MIVWDEIERPAGSCENLAAMQSIEITSLWNGEPAGEHEHTRLSVDLSDRVVTVQIDAPFHADPAPGVPTGRCERLWEHEVVELFLVGPDERYVEFEFGPHGHFLALELEGVRRIVDDRLPLNYSALRKNDRWHGTASIPATRLPRPIVKWNAFAIHGVADARRHLAAWPVPGEQPDFHRIESFSVVPRRR